MNAFARTPLLVLLPLLWILSGCTTRYQVRVDALSTLPARPASVQTFVFENKTPGDEQDSLFFKEVTRHLEPALKKAGFRPAADGPQWRIAVKAYLSDPLVETRTSFSPIYADYPGNAVVVRVPIVNSDGKVVRYAYTQYYTHSRRYLEGYVDRKFQVTVYDKILELSARRILPDGSMGEEEWSVKIAYRSPSTDYRASLAAMVVAAEPYFARRTSGEETIVISEDSEDLAALRRMMGDG